MEKTTRNKLVKLTHEFKQRKLTGYDKIEIKSVASCSEEEWELHCFSEAHKTAETPKFKVVLNLWFKEEIVSECEEKNREMFEGPQGLTLIMTDDLVINTLWHGFDIWP